MLASSIASTSVGNVMSTEEKRDEQWHVRTTLSGALQVDQKHGPAPEPELDDDDTKDHEKIERTGYDIEEDERLPEPELALRVVYDDNGDVSGYADGPIKLPQEFIEEYERHMAERSRIQDRLKQYVKEADIEYATKFLTKYVDADKAKRIAQDYAGTRNITFLVDRQLSEIHYDVFTSRNRIPGSDADRNAAVSHRLRENTVPHWHNGRHG
jgi:hypothetical protein